MWAFFFISQITEGTPMKQIIIHAPNEVGAIAEITEHLAKANVNIDAIEADTISESGLITLLANPTQKALEVLTLAGYDAQTRSPIMVCLDDEPGALASISQRFKDAQINVQALRIIGSMGHKKLLAITTDQRREAIQLVRDVMI